MTMMDETLRRRLLAAAPPGPWRTRQSYAGPWWVGLTGPCGCQRPDCDRGFTVVDDEHGAELAAAAPALAAEVLRLRAVIEGRVVPPTPKEIEGTVDGWPFYFRLRGGGSMAIVRPGRDPVMAGWRDQPLLPGEYLDEGGIVDGDGWEPHESAWRMLREAVAHWRATRGASWPAQTDGGDR